MNVRSPKKVRPSLLSEEALRVRVKKEKVTHAFRALKEGGPQAIDLDTPHHLQRSVRLMKLMILMCRVPVRVPPAMLHHPLPFPIQSSQATRVKYSVA